MKRYSSRWTRLKKRNEPINNLIFVNNKVEFVDYKDTDFLKKFINRQGEIVQSVFNKITTKYQKKISKAIKIARELALIPYIIKEQKEIPFQRKNFSNFRDSQKNPQS